MAQAGMSSTWWTTVTVASPGSSAASRSSAPITVSRPGRSRLAVGSSSRSRGGWFMSARATSTRRRSPSESEAKRCRSRPPQPKRSSSVTRALAVGGA